jgi:hypothetical protein
MRPRQPQRIAVMHPDELNPVAMVAEELPPPSAGAAMAGAGKGHSPFM